MVGWMVIFLPFRFTVEYYLLPFSIGSAVYSSGVMRTLWQCLSSAVRGGKACVAGALAAAAGLFALTLPNLITAGRVQLAVDSANHEVLTYLAGAVPGDGALIVNIQDPNEYYDEIGLYLSGLLGRPDIDLDFYRPGLADTYATGAGVFILSPQVENQPALTVRMGVVEETVNLWNAVLAQQLSGQFIVTQTIIRRVPMAAIELPRALCPLLGSRGYCTRSAPLVDTRVFSYGWSVFSVGDAPD
jgi:hypothetical protein